MNCLLNCIIPLCSLLVVTSCKNVPADTGTTAPKHVLISPPENLTIYYSGSSHLVVGWDIPHAYIMHEVLDKHLDMLVQASTLKVTKVAHPLVAEKVAPTQNVSDTNVTAEDISGANATGAPNVPSPTDTPISVPDPVDTKATKINSDGKESSDQDQDWVCKPAFKFANYTVKVNNYPGENDNGWATSLHDSKRPATNWELKYFPRKKLSAFNESCIKGFQVEWKRVDGVDIPHVLDVGPHIRTANLSGLRPTTTYNITVTAIYVSNYRMKSTPLYIMTRNQGEKSCKCDWHGTKDLSKKCVIQENGTFCSCRNGYEGAFCEKCSSGYYRTSKFTPCHKCPCDISTSASKSSCRFEQGFLQCDKCAPGHTGNICHHCAKGYYRYGLHCLACSCHGNTDPAAAETCHPITGMCLNCKRNTTGFNCERCLEGYHGDAVTYKNCTLTDVLSASSGGSSGIVAVLAILVVVIMAIPVTVILYRIIKTRRKRRAFWTVEMRRERDDVDFKNDDNCLEEVDDMDFYEKQGGSPSKYARLHETS